MRKLLYIILHITSLLIGHEALADVIPDRVYIGLATKHYGMDHLFDKEGPNEINPGLGFGWLNESNPRINYTLGSYYDSNKHISLTAGVSYAIIREAKFEFAVGVSATASLGKNATASKRSSMIYAWPYLQFTYNHIFLHWKPGLNRYLKPAGVFAFGLTFNLP